jgi:hypothetical protein
MALTLSNWYNTSQNYLISRGFLSSASPHRKLFDRVSGQILITGIDAVGKAALLSTTLSQRKDDIEKSYPVIGLQQTLIH